MESLRILHASLDDVESLNPLIFIIVSQIAPSIGLEVYFYSTCDIKIAVNIFTTDEHR